MSVQSMQHSKSFKPQWLFYVLACLKLQNSTFCPHSVLICFVWISEQTAIISLYTINWSVYITELYCVYCAVRTGYFNIKQIASGLGLSYLPKLISVANNRSQDVLQIIQLCQILPSLLGYCPLWDNVGCDVSGDGRNVATKL